MTVLQKKARGRRPEYFEDPAVDKLMAITMALAGEVAVMRDRLDTIERLSEAGEKISPSSVDAYQPDPDVRAARDAWREDYLDNVLRIVHQELEGMQRDSDSKTYEENVQDVEKA